MDTILLLSIAVRLEGDELLFLALIEKEKDERDLASRILANLNQSFQFEGK